jgi:hypothetical protein
MSRVKWFDKKFKFELSQDQFDSILQKLKETPQKIEKLVSSLSEEILTKRNDNKWSIKENIGHLIDLEELHDARIDDFIESRQTLRPADLQNMKTEEAVHNSIDISELIKQLKVVREKFVSRLSELDEATRDHISIHPRLNQPMRPVDMAQFVSEHDEDHIETIKELITMNQ